MIAPSKCFNPKGNLKLSFATKEEADEFAKRYDGAMKSYRCMEHGWHIGGILSRNLRKAIKTAKKRKYIKRKR